MLDAAFFHTATFRWVLLPLLIFLARVFDVSIGPVRIIMVSRSHKAIAALLGFFEVMVWLLAIGQIFKNMTNPVYYIAYGGGFAAGNFVGIAIEERLALGAVMVRTITQKSASELIERLREGGYMATAVTAESTAGEVDVIYTVLNRSDISRVMEIIKRFHPHAFCSISDIKNASEDLPPFRAKKSDKLRRYVARKSRKGK